MIISVFFCLLAFAVLLAMLRHFGLSLGLPLAYLLNLLLIHVPGAVAHLLDRSHLLVGREFTEAGIAFTAVGTGCFVIGVWLAQQRTSRPMPTAVPRAAFWKFCLLAGLGSTAVGFLFNIPSVGAALIKGGGIWMLGVMLALHSSLRKRDAAMAWRWLVALMIYPAAMLLVGGFLSYGILAVTVVLAILAVHVRSPARVAIGSLVAVVLGISLFLSYFEHRAAIRAAVWGGANADTRIEASLGAVRDASLFDPDNASHLKALDARLNQNYFVGLAAARLKANKVGYLHGKSVWEGLQSLVPRALWPEKPVVSGSPKVVSEMTGLNLSPTTSFGVGNVMEFQINYGLKGVIVGFLLLGFLLGWLDRQAAIADMEGRLDTALLYFLPAANLIQPNGSLVDMLGSAAAAVVAAFVWREIWRRFSRRSYATSQFGTPAVPGFH